MTVLVTGATGLVGNNVVRRLLAGGPRASVRCLVRKTSDQRPLEGLNTETAVGDVTDAASLDRVFEHVSAVIHCAAMVHIGWTGGEALKLANIVGTRNVADAARRAGVRMVHVSSADTLRTAGVDRIPYVSTKKAAEDEMREHIAGGLDAVIVKPAFILGPYDWKTSSGAALLAAATGWVPFAPRGSLNACDARDVAMAIVNALDKTSGGDEYTLGGHRISWLEALRRFSRLGRRWPPICRFDPLAQRAVGVAADMVGRISGREPLLNSAVMRLAGQNIELDDRNARSDLGYANRPLDETLDDTWRWFQAEGLAG